MEGHLAEVGAEGSRLVAALETAWQAIQASNPGVPDAVIVLGTGVERGRLSKLGHWWGGQWVADGTPRGEVLLAGEALHLKPTDVFEVLLHEAAHGLNTARGVKDVSRGGRYHNAKFKATAIEVGLRVGSMPPYGWAKTELAPATIEHYSAEIIRIGEEMRIARRLTWRDRGRHPQRRWFVRRNRRRRDRRCRDGEEEQACRVWVRAEDADGTVSVGDGAGGVRGLQHQLRSRPRRHYRGGLPDWPESFRRGRRRGGHRLVPRSAFPTARRFKRGWNAV